MAQNPIGTIADEERLVELRRTDGEFVVDVTDPVRTADVPESGRFAWRVRDEEDVPRLAFAPVDDEEAPDGRVRDLSDDGEATTLSVPEPLLIEGLELDPERYDDANPLLFEPNEIESLPIAGLPEGEPAGTAPTGVELAPVRFADGTPFRDEPVPESSMDSDPVAEAEIERQGDGDPTPQSGTITAPIDAAFVDEVLESSDLSRSEVVGVLETIARQDLIDESNDDTQYDPLVVDDRAVLVVDDAWDEVIAPQLDVDEEAIDAAREIHDRQAADLLRRSNADEDREIDPEFDDERDAVVIES